MAHAPPALFLIGHPRSGTHAAASLIAENGGLMHLGEVFHTDGIEYRENYFHFLAALKTSPLTSPQQSRLRFDAYLRYLGALWGETPILIDMKYDVLHLFDGAVREIQQPPGVFALLKAGSHPVVHLTRNILHLFFSTVNAVATKQWHVAGGETSVMQRIVVDIDFLMAFLYQKSVEVDEARRYMRVLTNGIEVEYEKLFGGDKDECARLFGFLGIEDQGALPTYKKQINTPYPELIENYQQVLDCVRGSPFAYLLTADEQGDTALHSPTG